MNPPTNPSQSVSRQAEARELKYEVVADNTGTPHWVVRVHHGPYVSYHYTQESAQTLCDILNSPAPLPAGEQEKATPPGLVGTVWDESRDVAPAPKPGDTKHSVRAERSFWEAALPVGLSGSGLSQVAVEVANTIRTLEQELTEAKAECERKDALVKLFAEAHRLDQEKLAAAKQEAEDQRQRADGYEKLLTKVRPLLEAEERAELAAMKQEVEEARKERDAGLEVIDVMQAGFEKALCAVKAGRPRDADQHLHLALAAIDQQFNGQTIRALRAEVEVCRKDINAVLEECGKHISLSNDFPWTEEVYCTFHALRRDASRQPNVMTKDDLFGMGDFRQWFDSAFPEPRSKHQRAARKAKENMAYAGWNKCNELWERYLKDSAHPAPSAPADHNAFTSTPETGAKVVIQEPLLRPDAAQVFNDVAEALHKELSAPAEAVTGENTGVSLIAAERVRQISKKGWGAEHDDSHTRGEMAEAAICYTQAAQEIRVGVDKWRINDTPEGWPWDHEWWKPNLTNPVRNLVKAGALVAAEIDRINRASRNKEAAK